MEKEDIKLLCSVNAINPTKHAEQTKPKTVRITHQRASELYSQNVPASKIHRELVSTNVKMFQFPTDRTPNLHAFHAGKHRSKVAEQLDDDPFVSLRILQNSNKYGTTIRSTGMKPFFTIYGSQDQILLFKEYAKRAKYSKVSCDATGSVIKSFGMFLHICFSG